MTDRLVTALALLLASGQSFAAPVDLSSQAIDAATFADWKERQSSAVEGDTDADTPASGVPGAAPEDGDAIEDGDVRETPDAFLIRLQVLLDRAHVSPGVIDGLSGGNTEKAVRIYEEMHDLDVDGIVDDEMWALLTADAAPAMQIHTITQEDVDGRYVPELPDDYGELAKLEWSGFRDPAEMLAERFHMDEDLLRFLNSGTDFGQAGATVLVADTGPEPETKVARIVVDKSKGELIAYDDDERIVLTSPATIGSADTPSPGGAMTVNGSAREPTYEYDPTKNFQQGENDEKLTIPPGPNGPVGSVWIDLSKPTYGIHGTPEPSQIDKSASHGCVRLTNWDAESLARLVRPASTTVEFRD